MRCDLDDSGRFEGAGAKTLGSGAAFAVSAWRRSFVSATTDIEVPSSTDLTNRFDAVRAWITGLQQGVGLRIVMRDVNHRVIGNNAVPREIWIDSLQEAFQLIGKGGDAQRFANLVDLTRDRFPQLLPLLERRPLEICELAKEWPVLLDIVAWMQQNPRPGIYLRQIDVPGVHTKYIEAHLGHTVGDV